MDTFFEQIVKKKKTPIEWCIIVGSVLGALVLITASLLYIPSLLLIIAVLAIFGAWWLITSQNNEFEYSVTNGDIDIDRIIAKRKRKRLVSVSGRKIECLLPFDAARVRTDGFQRVVVTAPSANEEGLWYFTYHSKKNGHTIVIFQPEERVLNALYAGLQKLVQLDTQRAARELGLMLTGSRGSHGAEE